MTLQQRQRRALWGGVGVLLVAALLRGMLLAELSHAIHYDEAYNALDALSLIEHPRLQLFFPENFGRQAGWMYWLVPWLLALGRSPFGLRLAAITTGLITTAGLIVLGRRLLGQRAGGWTGLAFGVLYWSVQINLLVLRANLFLMVGVLALAALARAYRRNARRDWLIAGGLAGLLAYTYFAALAWLALIGLLLVWWLIRDPGRRRGVLLAGITAAITAVPMLLTLFSQPNTGLRRVSDVGVTGLAEILANVQGWLMAWIQTGDTNILFNLPGRPILAGPAVILAVGGVIGFLLVARWRRAGLGVLVLAVASIAPSLLSEYAPHFLRAVGLTIPVALVIGAGGAWISSAGGRLPVRRGGLLLAVLLFGWMAGHTAVDLRGWISRSAAIYRV
jgi:hypothetical protein